MGKWRRRRLRLGQRTGHTRWCPFEKGGVELGRDQWSEQAPVPTTVSTRRDIVGETEGLKEKAKRWELG
jgi:hypothetical protein